MTGKGKLRVDILRNRFRATYKDMNPYNWGGDTWREWYSTHPMSEPIPKDMLPTEEQLRQFDIMEAKYIATHLTKNSEYSILLAYGDYAKGKPIEEVVWTVIAGARPCECQEAQCSFFCQYYGTENCYN